MLHDLRVSLPKSLNAGVLKLRKLLELLHLTEFVIGFRRSHVLLFLLTVFSPIPAWLALGTVGGWALVRFLRRVRTIAVQGSKSPTSTADMIVRTTWTSEEWHQRLADGTEISKKVTRFETESRRCA